MTSRIETSGRPRVVLVQTQAEGAGAQEIARIVGRGLTERGFDVHYLFFYRRTDAFDDIPNTFYCAATKPSGVGGVAVHAGQVEPHGGWYFPGHYRDTRGSIHSFFRQMANGHDLSSRGAQVHHFAVLLLVAHVLLFEMSFQITCHDAIVWL